MAIYDNDGTSTREIGKLYDNNGTSNFQIGKVYDNDGTSNHLIYTSAWSLIENWSIITKFSGYTGDYGSSPDSNTSLSKSGNNIIYKYGGGSQSIHCLPAFDVTKYSSVSITVASKTNTSVFYFGMTQGNIESGSAKKSSNITGTGTYTVDISSCTGSWKLAFRCLNASSGNATITAIDFS